jgi:ppGpp synthetase/RelA/SpoT-type nucleotidyltranferase
MPDHNRTIQSPVLAPEFQAGGLLDTFDKFCTEPRIKPFMTKYIHDAAFAEAARDTLYYDFEDMKDEYYKKHKTSKIVSFDARVKDEKSFMKKFYNLCRTNIPATGVNNSLLLEIYENIYDLCGGRFSCPYLSDVEPTLNDYVRPFLKKRGYLVDLQADPRFVDKNTLLDGDGHGYRSYHFYVQVPTIVDIYDNIEMCLCEMQVRTELQHVWAVKSHDLMYKPLKGEKISDPLLLDDMKRISDSLSIADGYLDSIRTRVNRVITKRK